MSEQQLQYLIQLILAARKASNMLGNSGGPVFPSVQNYSERRYLWPKKDDETFACEDSTQISFKELKAAVATPDSEWAAQSMSCRGENPQWIHQKPKEVSSDVVSEYT